MEANVLSNPGQISKPVLFRLASFWSDVSSPTKDSKNNADPLSQLFNYNWGRNQVMKVFQKLGFSRTHDFEAPLYEGWIFDPNQIRDDNWGTVAKSLMYQSSNMVEHIPFEVLVDMAANQISPKLRDFLEKYESLYTQICSFYLESPNTVKPVEHLLLMKEHLEDKATGADPFIRTVVQDAYNCVSEGTTRKRDLIALLRHFITDPLMEQLHESIPQETVLRRKKVLEARLKRHLSGSDNNWDKPFDASTPLLDGFVSLEPRALAESLTKIDHDLYRKLDVNSFQDKGQALQTLKRRENDLTCSVTECVDARLLNENQLFELAQHFCDMSNYLSMDAVRNGVRFAQSSSEIKRQLQNLVDLEQLRNMGKPGLYPLLRAATSVVRENNTELAKEYINLCVLYTIERSGSTGTWAEGSGNMTPTDTITVLELERGRSTRFSLSSTTVNAASPVWAKSREMEYCRASLEKSVGIDESLNPLMNVTH
ncbi:hypothetical protein N7522_006281 [Penicillium canescens]|nr:hypothetical protein N7522_006281 [Penicillium canescens]